MLLLTTISPRFTIEKIKIIYSNSRLLNINKPSSVVALHINETIEYLKLYFCSSKTRTAAIPGDAIIWPINKGISIFAYKAASAHSSPRKSVINQSPNMIKPAAATKEAPKSPRKIFPYQRNIGSLLFLRVAISDKTTLRILLATSTTGWLIKRKAMPYNPTCAIGIYLTKSNIGRLDEKLNIALEAVKYLGKSI